MLASASYDNTVLLWDTTTGALRQTLEGHKDIHTITFSLNSKMLASASHDNTVWLWDAATGAHLQTLAGQLSRSYLSISDGYLKTDRGLLCPSDTPSTPARHEDLTSIIFADEYRITRNAQTLLWLPPDYRTACADAYKNVLVFGHASGQVIFLHFAIS